MYNIECFAVFKRAFRHMTEILFRPFDIVKWFVLGFSAWLATMFNSAGFRFEDDEKSRKVGLALRDIFLGDGSFVGRICRYFQIEESIFWLIISGTVALMLFMIAVTLILLWISSRFKFIFINNLANDNTEIADAWTRFKEPGNSAFRWLFAWGAAVSLISVTFFIIMTAIIYPLANEFSGTGNISISGLLVLMFVAAIYLFIVSFMLIGLYLFNEFVLLIMFRRNMHARSALREFMKLLGAAPLTFLKFIILQILVSIACFIVVAVFIICTCCIAAKPLFVPYIGTVLLLPVFVFQRLQAMELMAAFGDEFSPYPQKTSPEGK
ncbi:MAG: hypothetical protein WC082_04400 [Victivallales bacterium]